MPGTRYRLSGWQWMPPDFNEQPFEKVVEAVTIVPAMEQAQSIEQDARVSGGRIDINHIERITEEVIDA